MGSSLFRGKSHTEIVRVEVAGPERVVVREVEVPLPNPNPENFTVEKVYSVGTYTCALVHYPDATNFEGRKVIVFEDTAEEDVTGASTLDPHFAEDSSIIARFRPDEEGWTDGLAFADRKASS